MRKVNLLLFCDGFLSQATFDVPETGLSFGAIKELIAKAVENPSVANAQLTMTIDHSKHGKIVATDDESLQGASSWWADVSGEVTIDATVVNKEPAQVSASEPTRRVHVVSQRFGEFFAEVVDGEVELPLSRNGLLDALVGYIRSKHADIRSGATVTLKATVDQDIVLLASDAILANVLDSTVGAALHVSFETNNANSLSAPLVLVFNDLVGHREATCVFRYTIDGEQLLNSLKHECIHELDLPTDATLSLTAEVEGQEESIASDRALQQLLSYVRENSTGGDPAPVRVIVSVTRRIQQQKQKVTAQYLDTLASSHVSEFEFAYSIEQEKLLATLKDAIRHAFDTYLTPTSNIDLAATLDGEDVPLSSDKQLLNVLSDFCTPQSALHVVVREAVTNPSIGIAVYATLQQETAEFRFSFAFNEGSILKHLREECALEFDTPFSEGDALVVLSEDGSMAPLVSDTVLREVVSQLQEQGLPLKIAIRRVSRAARVHRSVECTLGDETAQFSFDYSLDQPNLVKYLEEECKAELDLMPNDTIQLSVMVDGDVMTLKNDRDFRELLSQMDLGDVLKLLASQGHDTSKRSKAVTIITRQAICEFEGVSENVQLRYVVEQDGLLEHLLSEVKEAFDLIAEAHISIAFRIGSDDVIIHSDAEAREMLGFVDHEGSGALHILATRDAPAQNPESAAFVERAIECTLGEDVAKFELKFAVSQDGLLDFLMGECKSELDLMPNEIIRLTTDHDGTEVMVNTDATLREFLISTTGVLRLTAALARSRVEAAPKPAKRLVRCSLNGEVAEFELAYTIDQENLWQYLLEECKAALDLMPSDQILLAAVISGDVIPLRTDTELRELLSHIPLPQPLELMAEEVKSSPARTASVGNITVSIKLEVHCKGDEMAITFRFRSDEVNILQSLKSEIRGDFELDPSADIQILAALESGEMPHALRCDADVFRLLQSPTHSVKLFVQLSKTPQELHEEMPLNRIAELNALHYDWIDIFSSNAIEANDIKTVISNVKFDGVPIPISDPIFVKLTELANEETVLDVDTHFLPFLESLVAHMSDVDVSRFTHGCRGVIEFMVDHSSLFRLRRTLSDAFRSLATDSSIPNAQLLSLLASTNLFDASDLETVFTGYGARLNRREYNNVMEQLFGDRPQDVAEFIAATQSSGAAHKLSTEGQHAVFELRRTRLVADIRHAFDGVSAIGLTNFANEVVATQDEQYKTLIWALSSLAGGPQGDTDALTWFQTRTKDEVAVYNLLHELLQFKNSSISLPLLTQICQKLNEPSMDPSLLLSRCSAAHGVASWCLGAARFVCHTRREMFPPVNTLQPRPPSARKAAGEHGRGLSSPYVLQKISEEAAAGPASSTKSEEPAPHAHLIVERFQPRLRHLSNDLEVTQSQPQRLSLREIGIPNSPQRI